MTTPRHDDARRRRFPQRMKLHGEKAFAAVYAAQARATAGFLTVFAKPNGLKHSRLGLSVPRGGGTAVQRNLTKRRLREAFRLTQHDLPGGYDLTIRVRPHTPRSVDEYASSLATAMKRLDELWRKRQRNQP